MKNLLKILIAIVSAVIMFVGGYLVGGVVIGRTLYASLSSSHLSSHVWSLRNAERENYPNASNVARSGVSLMTKDYQYPFGAVDVYNLTFMQKEFRGRLKGRLELNAYNISSYVSAAERGYDENLVEFWQDESANVVFPNE